MNQNETSGQEPDGRTDRQPAVRNELAAAASEKTLKRARWENFRFAPCEGAKRVNVTNDSYGDEATQTDEHTYTVNVEAGQPTDCTCPAAEYQSGPCKHAVALADAPDVIAEAMGAESESKADTSEASTGRAVATDGGTTTAATPSEGATETAQNLSRESRPELRGYVDVQREADGSPREIALTVGYGSFGDRGPSRTDLALTYRVGDDGTAHVSRIEDDTSGRTPDWIGIETFRVLALADDLVARVPDVVLVERFERELADLRETYTAELNHRCNEDGCYEQADAALDSGYCRRHDPEVGR